MANGNQTFGVTPAGFRTKPLAVMLEEAFERARVLFGDDVDLRSSSALRKIIELSLAETGLNWAVQENAYYANFIPTAHGRQLDLLGYDLGLERRFLYSEGTVQFKLGGEPKPGCNYVIPLGTVLETATGTQFRTLDQVILTQVSPEGIVPARAVKRGPGGNANPSEITSINATYIERFFNFPPPPDHVQVTVKNTVAFSGGELLEDDHSFRMRLMALPHTIWTADALQQAVLAMDGVRDCLVQDLYGGLDTTKHWYGSFKYKQEMFNAERDYCAPYFFDVIVAPEPGVVWESGPGLPGLYESIEAGLRDLRPIATFPSIQRACAVEIAVKAEIRVEAGFDINAVRMAIQRALDDYLLGLRMDDDVIASEVLCVIMDIPGVVDVHDLRLLRCPPRYGRVIFCKDLKFQDQAIEAACGENLVLAPREIAEFRHDMDLLKLEVVTR